MKKLAILAAVLMLIPASVMAGMNILNESSLNDVTGQVGITIDTSVRVVDGFLAWGDSDGHATEATGGGFLVLDGLTVNDGLGGTGAMTQDNLTIDAGTTLTTSYLVIGLPSITGQIGIANIFLGSTISGASESLGSITIGDLDVPSSTIMISAH